VRSAWRSPFLFAGLLLLVVVVNAWLVTTEAGARVLLEALELRAQAADPAVVRAGAQAIVVVGGQTSRVHEGARLHLATGVPIALVGKGTGDSGFEAESEKMEDILLRQYGIGPRWVETESRDTRENALFAWCLLSSFDVKRIALVTHAFHMERARGRFEAVGFDVIPDAIPDGALIKRPPLSRASFLPSKAGMAAARLPVREWIGVLFAPLETVFDPPRSCPYGPVLPH